MSHKRSVDLIHSPTYLSVGSNVGDREETVLGVARDLERLGIARRVRMSSLYETEPVGVRPMREFVNAVIELQPLLSPVDLLNRLQALEKVKGRVGGHNEPRELDIDIVAMGETSIQTKELTVPHPCYRERAFVLVPLRELAPTFRCPATGQSVNELLETLREHHGLSMISTRRVVFA